MPNGFNNDLMFAQNADFTGNATPAFANGLQTDGQLWIGTTAVNAGGTHINVGKIVPADGSITVNYVSPNIVIGATGGSIPPVQTLSDDINTTVSPSGNNIQLQGHVVNQTGQFSTTVSAPSSHLIKFNPMSSARWIVDKLGFNGTHTTIASALASATSGDTIFIMPGTYTENLTLVAGVNLTAWGSDSSQNQTGKVIISGKASFSSAGSVTISGIQLQTNSDNFLALTGSAASIVNLVNCNLNCSNNTGISFTSSSSSAVINCKDCTGNLGTTGIGYFTHSSAGNLNFTHCVLTNTGGSTTASTVSAGVLYFFSCKIFFAVTSSSTAALVVTCCAIDTGSINTTSITSGGSSVANTIHACVFSSGTASALSVSANTMTITNCRILSSNTNPITGAGTVQFSNLDFNGGNTLINTTTQTGGVFGLATSIATPTLTGFIGEQIRGTRASGSAVSLTTSTPADVIAGGISLTPGVWDLSGITIITGGLTGTLFATCITATSATLNGVAGDSQVSTPTMPTGTTPTTLVIPAYRVVVTTTTSYYLVVDVVFSAGTCTAFGRLSATRVA